jgi:hypothetical protein
MKPSHFFACLLVVVYCGMANAQDAVRKQEFQVSLDIPRGIRALSAYYKLNFKKNHDKYWRTSIGVSSEDIYHHSTDLIHNNTRTIFAAGFEKRIPPTKNSQLFGGAEVYGLRETIQAFKPDSLVILIPETEILAVGIGFPVGIVFNKTSKWFVGIEVVPSFQYQKTTKDDYKISPNPGKSCGYNINSFAVCFGYRIPTKRI